MEITKIRFLCKRTNKWGIYDSDIKLVLPWMDCKQHIYSRKQRVTHYQIWIL